MKRKCVSYATMRKVYARDEMTCQNCGKVGELINRYGVPRVVDNPDGIEFDGSFYNGDDVIPFEIDHIVPLVEGGDNSLDNLQLLCRYCNRSKSMLKVNTDNSTSARRTLSGVSPD